MESSRCSVCSSERVIVLLRRPADEIRRCRNCGLAFRWPPVTKSRHLEELNRHYARVDPAREVARSRRGMYEDFLRRIRPLNKGGGRLLDIGCGLGYFLSLARDEGWDVWGLDANAELVREGLRTHGIKLQCADFEEADLPAGYFDVVTLWNVLEELPDPAASIRKIGRILKPSGLLFVRGPNLDFHLFAFRVQKLLVRLGLGNIMPQQSFLFHIFNYSAKSLKRMLIGQGFSNVRVLNSAPTSGNPYGVRRGAATPKKAAYLLAKVLSSFSRRVTLAPSIEACAENGKD